MPLPGATVEISSPALLAGKRSTTTSARGTYVFLNLPVGRYQVTASRDAFKTVVQENVDVSAASVVTVDVTLPVGTVAGESHGHGREPDRRHQDLHRSTRRSTATCWTSCPRAGTRSRPRADDPRHVPRVGRHPVHVPEPHRLRRARRTRTCSSSTVSTPPIPRAGSFGSLVNVNYDAVEEVRIVALGSRAEYGSFSGAAIDVLTKSGSNTYHGSAAFYSKLGSRRRQPARPRRGPRGDFLYVNEGDLLASDIQDGLGGARARWAGRSSRTSCGSSAPSTTTAAPACPRCRR